MIRCPACNKIIDSFITLRADSNGSGMAPRAIVVLAITCPYCNVVLGVLQPPAA